MPNLDNFVLRNIVSSEQNVKEAVATATTSATIVNLSTEEVINTESGQAKNLQHLEENVNILEQVEIDNFQSSPKTIADDRNATKTDMGHYVNINLTDQQIRFIINNKVCNAKGPFPRDPKQENRCFSTNYYTENTMFGKISREWLRYSEILDSVYCEPCWLFSTGDSEWRTGVRTWKSLSWKIKRHACTQNHITTCKTYELWRNNETIDKEIEAQLRYETSFWKLVLDRLFSITLMLAQNNLAFRGHREGNSLDEKTYQGNFIAQVNLLAKYDSVLKQVVEMPSGLFLNICFIVYTFTVQFYFY